MTSGLNCSLSSWSIRTELGFWGKKRSVQWVMLQYEHIHIATRQPSFNHRLPICEKQIIHAMRVVCHRKVTRWGPDSACGVRTTMIKWCQGWQANFWCSYQDGDWQATCPQLTPKSQFACQAFCEIRGRGCSIRRDELRGRWLEARAHLDISRARSSRPAYKLWFESMRSPDNFDLAFKAT